jgi:hypothetical protein
MSTDNDGHSARVWATQGIDAAALAALSRDLPATELWSLLLSVAEQRATARSPAKLLQQYQQDRFVTPALVDPRTQLELDTQLFAAAEGFEAVELSPLAPLGVCSAIAPTSQNRVVATVRGTEVVSDPTNVLALESAKRLRVDPAAVVKLATSHRCVRAQAIPRQSGFAAHFRLFCLTSAGHETKDQAFAVSSLLEHIRVHLTGLDRLEQHGYTFPDRSIVILSRDDRKPLAQRIVDALSGAGLAVVHEPLTKPYYDGLRFMISARAPSGAALPLIDGGAFDWVATLAANRKLVFVASAIGSQLAAYLFRTPASAT